MAHQGELVYFVREPHNKYDHNAIRVENSRGETVGHIKAIEAKAVRQVMDDPLRFGVVKIDGSILRPAGKYSQSILLELYSYDRSSEEFVCKLLRSVGIDIITSRSSFNPVIEPPSIITFRSPFNPVIEPPPMANEPTYRLKVELPKIEPCIMNTVITDWKSEEDLDAVFDRQQEALMNISPIEPPPQLRPDFDLMKHQLVGLSWMYDRENTEHANPLYDAIHERGKTVWKSKVTRSSQEKEPVKVRGGLICDEMGMGKTIMTLCLILINPPPGHTYPSGAVHKSDKASSSLQKSQTGALKSVSSETSTKSCITTLIVCPVSVMSNWINQVEQHIKPGVLRVATYQGPNRMRILDDVARNKIDIMLASYQTLAVDYANEFGDKDKNGAPSMKKMKQTSIFSFKYHRIVLDEAHIIRNPKTAMSKACLEFDAEFKFGLSGTPIQNKPEDICSLFQFLGVEPVSNPEIFRRSIARPIREGDPTGLALLRSIFSHFALRRTKAKEGISLPKKTVEICSTKFPEGSVYYKIYFSLFRSARVAFQAILTAGEKDALKEYSSILETILRLRQAW